MPGSWQRTKRPVAWEDIWKCRRCGAEVAINVVEPKRCYCDLMDEMQRHPPPEPERVEVWY